MLEFMREGGYAMWLILITGLALLVFGFTRQREQRSAVFLAGTILLLLEALLGMASGMKAVAAFASHPRFAGLPDQAALVATGLGELSNNGLLGAALALLLGAATLIARGGRQPA